MRRITRRVPIVSVMAVVCLLLTSCAYITRVSGEFGPSPGALTAGGDISNDGSMVVFLSTRAIDAGDTNNEFDVFVSDRNNEQIYRLSGTPFGGAPSARANDPAISGDGFHVVWASRADNVVTGDTNESSDIFWANLATGDVELVSRSSTGELGNWDSSQPSISDDGRYIAFASIATNLVPGDTNNREDIFVRDTVTGETTRWSTSATGTPGNGASLFPDISGDGKTVVFTSWSSNLVAGDSNGDMDIFRKRSDGSIDRISLGPGGVQANEHSSQPVVNADGSVVAFQSDATNLDPADTNGVTDVFVWRNGTVELASLGTNGEIGSSLSRTAFIDGSGDLVGFSTMAPEITGSTSMEAIVRNVAEGRTDVVSSDLLGSPGSAFDTLEAISGNGRFALVRGVSTDLIANDTNNAADMFVKSYPQPEITDVWPPEVGRGTTTVTIEGRGFVAPMRVLLDENPGVDPVVGPVTVIDSNTLTVEITLPQGAVADQPLVVVTNLGAFVGDLGASGACGGCLAIG